MAVGLALAFHDSSGSSVPISTNSYPGVRNRPTAPATDWSTTRSTPSTPSVSTPPDPMEAAEIGSCFYEYGTVSQPDLVTGACVSGAFKVVRVFRSTTDLNSCDHIDDSDRSVSSKRHNLVLCLSYLNSGGMSYHAQPGQCVFGPNGPGPWDTQPCQTGNFKVLAVYKSTDDSTDEGKCKQLRRADSWKKFPANEPDLARVLCLSMNYPDDAGRAAQYQCLLRSGDRNRPTFTDVGSCAASNVFVTGRTNAYDAGGFCGNDGWTTWRSEAFPDFSYTMCWRWL